MNSAPEVIRFIIQLFCIAAMAAIGLGVTLDDIRAPFRNVLALVLIIVVNSLLVPLVGILILLAPQALQGSIFEGVAEQIAPLTGGQATGFLLLFVVAGTLSTPVLAQVARAGEAFARGVTVVLIGVSALTAAVILPLIAGGAWFTKNDNPVSAGSVFMTLLLYQLLPLAMGVLIKSRYDILARLVRPLIVQLAGLAFLVAAAVLMMSGQSLLQFPERVLVPEESFPSTILTTTVTLDDRQAPMALAQDFESADKPYPENAQVEVLEAGKKWVLFNASKTAVIARTEPATTTLELSLADEGSPLAQFDGGAQAITELNDRRMNQGLQESLKEHKVTLDAPLIVVVAENDRWLFAEENQTYYIEAVDDVFSIYKETSEPAGIVEEFLKALDALPDVGPAIDFLLLLVKVVLPYLLFVAVAALLMVIGHYGGVAVRSLVGASGPAVPRAMAITTALRNVSMALILASQYVVEWQASDLSALTVILVFQVVSLAVVGRQAAQWRAEEVVVSPATVVAGAERAALEAVRV